MPARSGNGAPVTLSVLQPVALAQTVWAATRWTPCGNSTTFAVPGKTAEYRLWSPLAPGAQPSTCLPSANIPTPQLMVLRCIDRCVLSCTTAAPGGASNDCVALANTGA